MSRLGAGDRFATKVREAIVGAILSLTTSAGNQRTPSANAIAFKERVGAPPVDFHRPETREVIEPVSF